jgi:hypothetical protein
MSSETVSQNSQTELPKKLIHALWRRVDRRLQRGEVLITTEHFQKVMEQEFRKLIHMPPSPRIRVAIYKMITTLNEEHPETFLSLGIKNAVTRYLHEMEERAGSESANAVEENRKRIRQMVKEGRTAFFLESIGVEVGERGVPASVERSIEKIVSGQKLVAEPEIERRSQKRRRGTGLAPVHLSGATTEEQDDGPAQVGPPSQQETQERIEKMKAAENAIADAELSRASKHLDSYIQQDLLEEEEAVSLRELYGIDERLAKGEIDEAEAARLRGEMDAGIRDKIEARLRAAVDFSVHYINAFEALKRISSRCDDSLKFLIRYKDLVTSEDPNLDLSAATDELEGAEDTLESLNRLMERKEHEARMISANLPPYRHVTGQGKIGNLVIEEDFIDELRSLTREGLSDRLNAPEPEVRVKPAAEIRCMVALIQQLIAPSPFHRAVRNLHIRQIITQTYRSSAPGKAGKNKVQHYVKQRMPRLYPDIDTEEQAQIEAESQKIMDAIDKEREGGDNKNELRVYRA